MRRSMIAVCLTCMVMAIAPARADDESIIRDDEIERDIKGWITPVVAADSLDPDNIHIVLVQAPEINAFVAGGPNIFLYTGLILKAENPDEIVGVLSHELGHIEGGHLIRGKAQMDNASFEALLGSIIGIAAAAAGGGSGGMALGAAGSSMAMRNYLAFSRVQEGTADAAAINGMRRAHINPTGMQTFLEKLRGEELLPESQQDKYVQTHPLTQERIFAVENGVAKSPYKDQASPAIWTAQYARIRAKLIGFTQPQQVPYLYPATDTSIPARYARTIAAYRDNHIEESLHGIDALLKDEPQNPYFWELKGQMLTDYGHVADAVPAYAKSVAILPDAALIRIPYANALLESSATGEKAKLRAAVEQLDQAVRAEPRSIMAQHLLAIAYGRLGLEAVAKLHLADEAALKGDKRFARTQAREAAQGLKPYTPDWIRANDILDSLGPDKDAASGPAMRIPG